MHGNCGGVAALPVLLHASPLTTLDLCTFGAFDGGFEGGYNVY